MDKEFQFIIKVLKNIKLSENERILMRNDLFEKLNISKESKNLEKDRINSLTSRLYYYYQDIKNNYFMINKNKFAPIFIIILFVVFIGGVSAFAEKAIPGDLLYGIKVSINEPVASIFALSKEEKTEWQERLVERRLEEMQKLVSNNNFNETLRLSLESKIKNHIDQFSLNATELSLEKKESLDSSNLNIRLQASLKAYENVFESLSSDTTLEEDTKKETEKLLVTIGGYKDKVSSDHNNLELSVGVNLENVSSTPENVLDFNSTSTKQTAALDLLTSVKLSYQKDKINLSTNIQNQIDDKFALAETTLEEGNTFLIDSDYQNATDKFQLVINEANEVNLLMLSNIIKGDIENDIGLTNDDDINDDISDDKGIDIIDDDTVLDDNKINLNDDILKGDENDDLKNDDKSNFNEQKDDNSHDNLEEDEDDD